MQLLRRAAHLQRLVLACLVMSWAAVAFGAVLQPKSLELVCSASSGTSMLVAVDADGNLVDGAGASFDCALCLPVAPLPALPLVPPAPQPLPLAHALQPVEAARIAAATAAPLPARGPPARA